MNIIEVIWLCTINGIVPSSRRFPPSGGGNFPYYTI